MTGSKAALIADEEWMRQILQQHGPPPADHWARAIACLELTPQQMGRFRALYRQWQARVRDARACAMAIAERMHDFAEISSVRGGIACCRSYGVFHGKQSVNCSIAMDNTLRCRAL